MCRWSWHSLACVCACACTHPCTSWACAPWTCAPWCTWGSGRKCVCGRCGRSRTLQQQHGTGQQRGVSNLQKMCVVQHTVHALLVHVLHGHAQGTRHKRTLHICQASQLCIARWRLNAAHCNLGSTAAQRNRRSLLACFVRSSRVATASESTVGLQEGQGNAQLLVDGNRVTHGLASALEQTTYMLADDSGVLTTSPCAFTLLTLLPQQLPGPASQAARQR